MLEKPLKRFKLDLKKNGLTGLAVLTGLTRLTGLTGVTGTGPSKSLKKVKLSMTHSATGPGPGDASAPKNHIAFW